MWGGLFISFGALAATSGSDSIGEPLRSEPGKPSLDNDCGRRPEPEQKTRQKRIIGGNNVKARIPWQAELQQWDEFICGGAIVSPHAVVTAAHCLSQSYHPRNYPGIYKVVVGSLALGNPSHIPEPNQQNFTVTDFVLHPDWDPSTLSNDLAVVVISSETGEGVQWSPSVSPICLAIPSSPEEGDKEHPGAKASPILWTKGEEGLVSGFGHTEEGGQPAQTLQEANVPVVSEEQCKSSYREIDHLKQICAGADIGGIDSCQGDSGGPFAANVSGRYYLAGVVSFGYGCGRAGFPGVYTRVEHYLTWIHGEINKSHNTSATTTSTTTSAASTISNTSVTSATTTKITTSTTSQPTVTASQNTSTSSWLAFFGGVFTVLILGGLVFAWRRWRMRTSLIIPHIPLRNAISEGSSLNLHVDMNSA